MERSSFDLAVDSVRDSDKMSLLGSGGVAAEVFLTGGAMERFIGEAGLDEEKLGGRGGTESREMLGLRLLKEPDGFRLALNMGSLDALGMPETLGVPESILDAVDRENNRDHRMIERYQSISKPCTQDIVKSYEIAMSSVAGRPAEVNKLGYIAANL
ncbi:uncharacterized protein KY384_005435 [Bacidia gigantensis]|uniref:uncharacterized protein n=1 Tax=Bacidia gigantensis TaxID=2732470 RepID=UPI001D04A5A1|nr:uncharacterized protein KY384_005435 [Bacidia gigantensis]KAG8529954.1 hypothetical protein KY384_005435 [Bacidia gigantensis]